jgi:hypothetical protein
MTQFDTCHTQRRNEHLAQPRGSETFSEQQCKRVNEWLGRVGEAAERNKETKFTALDQQLTPFMFERSFYATNPKAKPGVDGVIH